MRCVSCAGGMASVAPHLAGLAMLVLSPELDVIRLAALHACAELLPGLTSPEAVRQASFFRSSQRSSNWHAMPLVRVNSMPCTSPQWLSWPAGTIERT